MKLFVFHFTPIEHYPPIQNLLGFINTTDNLFEVTCFSTYGRLEQVNFKGKKIKVYRLGNIVLSKFQLWAAYLLYNIISILFLAFVRPEKVMYYESLSSFPVFIYKKFLNKKAEIYIHYHEYTTLKEYKRSPFIRRFFHAKESYLYANASWISHTNMERLKRFLNDENIKFDKTRHHVMPNYPSKRWAINNKEWKKGEPIKFIYVGYSLTEVGSYLSELISFLKESKELVEINIYCMVVNNYLKGFIESEGGYSLKVHTAMPYELLPYELSKHHIGLILYKAKTQNYIYNAPNKLFEYLSCGLDVWYPSEMQGIHFYESEVQTKIRRINFNNIHDYKLKDLIKKESTVNKVNYFAEDVYGHFLKALT